jgi:nucleotide-binding universal stress UspA family protein
VLFFTTIPEDTRSHDAELGDSFHGTISINLSWRRSEIHADPAEAHRRRTNSRRAECFPMSAFRRPRPTKPIGLTGWPAADLQADRTDTSTRFVHEDNRAVLVAVDGYTGAWDALEWAAAEAAARDCPLRITHALTWPLMFDPYGVVWAYRDDSGYREAAELLLMEAEFRAREVAHDLRVTTHLQEGPMRSIALSDEHDSSLIVLDRGHSRGVGGPLAGSPAARIARNADCPVAVVGPAQQGPCGPCPSTVVVGLSGTGKRPALLGFAFRAARRRGVGVTAVHAWTTQGVSPATGALTSDSGTRRRYLEDVLAPWRAAFPDVRVSQRLVNEAPGGALVAHSAGAALLVIGSNRRGRFSSNILRGPTRAVLDAVSAPVVIVRE